MNDEEVELFARINLHEFLLEQLFANGAMTRRDPKKNWDKFSVDLIKKVRLSTTVKSDAPEMQEIHARMLAMTERFCAKVSESVMQEAT